MDAMGNSTRIAVQGDKQVTPAQLSLFRSSHRAMMEDDSTKVLLYGHD